MNTQTAENILDVTLLEPRLKHPTIFSRFDELPEGSSLTIHNDHDPKPLYYQFLSERGNVFIWEYLEEGPERWKVMITKRQGGLDDETLGEIAVQDLRKTQIFKKYGLDFCCGGNKTVKEACAEKGIDITLVENELQHSKNFIAPRPLPYNEWKLDFLCDFILHTHHSYVIQTLPELRRKATRVGDVHGHNHPELYKIQELVEDVHSEITAHMKKEEVILFPFIKSLVTATENPDASEISPDLNIDNPLKVMLADHELVGSYLAKIRELSQNYLVPEDGCQNYKTLYEMLEQFEDDLHLHIHLENNILFPKALALEKELKRK